MVNEFHVRSARPYDAPVIRSLLSQLMPHADPEARWRWCYEDGSDGPAHTVLAFHRSGTPVGMASLFPRRAKVGNRIVRAALGGDDFVIPEYRRRGVAAMMHTAGRMLLPAENLAFVYGTPVPANSGSLLAAGARDIAFVSRYVRPAVARHLAFGAPPPGNVIFSAATLRDPRIDEVWRLASTQLPISIVRDAAFYDARFHRSPAGVQRPWVLLDEGEPIASCVIEPSTGRLRVIDLVVVPDAWLRAIRAITILADDTQVNVELMMTTDEARRRGLWWQGFLARESLPLNIGLPYGSTWSAIEAGSDWTISWADTDVDDTARRDRMPMVPMATQRDAE